MWQEVWYDISNRRGKSGKNIVRHRKVSGLPLDFWGDCDMEEIFTAQGICHFEALVERMIKEEKDVKSF